MNLHDYQRTAVAHLHQHPRGALFLDMGLGKTAITLSALTADHLPALVTAPKRVAENVWPTEARLWRPDLKVVVAAGTPLQRKRALHRPADITVIGRDNLSDAEAVAHRYRTFVIDELSGFKARGTKRWKAARRIIRAIPHPRVWGLTGTPAPNGLLDLWAQVFLIDNGERLGATLTAYRSRYFTPGHQLPNGVITEWRLRPEADAAIHSKLEDICLSMKNRVKALPPVHNTVVVPLPPKARSIYRNLKDTLVADLDLIGGGLHTAANSAVLSTKLSQVSAGFLYHEHPTTGEPLSSYDTLHTEKVKATQEIIDGTGSPVLVFYRFRAEREMLLSQLSPTPRTIDQPGVLDDWNAGRVPVLLAHPASAGHGLNLQHGGHTAIWTSLPWSLEEWEQSNKRLDRQGQQHTVVIHVLSSPRTVDTAIRAALEGKATVQQALLDHLESPL